MKKQLFILTSALLSLTATAQIPNYVPTNGLVGWWPFNGNANDESGNGNNGTVNGATPTTDRFGNVNKSYSFDGNDFIEIPLFFDSNERTFSVWFVQVLSNGIGQIIVDNDHAQLMNGNSTIAIRSDDTLQPSFGSAFCILNYQPLEIWTNVIVSRDMDSTFFYLNGSLTCSVVNSNTHSLSSINNFIKFGCTRLHDRFLNGKLDDIGIWNRALTACEIQDLYNASLPNSTQTQTALDSYTWPVNGQTYTQSGQYTVTLLNAAGCDSIVTLDLTLSFTGINEINSNPTKKLLKITDLNGKETPFRKNTVLLFIYEDGTVERIFEMEY